MTKIKNTNAYPFDVKISDEDYVIGSDGDNLGKITRNYKIGDLRRYINSGLSPEVDGTLKVSEITYNGVLTSPSEVANALDPNYQVLQYHIVIFSVNGNKYILKEQDITLGLSGKAITDEDFILIIGFTKLGDGTNVLKGYNTSTGLHEFYSIKKDGNLLNLTESLGNIILSINETELSAFIKENCKTYSVLNAGTGAEIYKDSTVVGDNTQFNLKSLKLSQLGGGAEVIRELQDSSDEILFINRTLVSDNNSIDITVTDNTISLDINNTWLISFLQSNSNTLCEIFSNCTVDPIIGQGEFGYSLDSEATACLKACKSTDLVQMYRDNVFGRFEQATRMSTDSAMSIPAPVGYYTEFSTEMGDSVSRYWDGSNLGVPFLCGCPI